MSFITRKQDGFTIVELLIVIVVIAILATISVVAYTGLQQRARDSKRVNDMAQIKKALLAYDVIHGGVVRPGVTGYTKPVGEPTFGGWDVSTSANWLLFLRSTSGLMPIDPSNTIPNTTTTSPIDYDNENRLYAYYCYDAGHANGLPDSAAVLLFFKTESGTIRADRFRVSSCLTALPT